MPPITAALAACFLLAVLPAKAAETHVAVAANFAEPAREIAGAFKAKTGDEAVLSFGASGQFYTQITQDAPFDILLSADDARPKKLVAEGLGVAGGRFTYAVGTLVLWSRDPALVMNEPTLREPRFAKLSIANPDAAPYGVAAIETMKALGVYDALKPRIVQGSSIAQAFQFAETGNAELGFVSLSQVIGREGSKAGSRWDVPPSLYTPIRQDAVLLKRGVGNTAATGFLAFLKGPEARAVIEKYGYALGD